MIKVAITGNIASGKSEVEKILKNRGMTVLDTDAIAHKILDEKKSLLIDKFKGYDITENDVISREKLGKLVFNNVDLKKKLENIVHPLIKQYIYDYFDENKNEKLVFVSVPLLFETGMDKIFDKIIFVQSDDEIRLKRLMARNNWTKDYAKIRMNSQNLQDEKIKQSDYVIKNNGSIDDLKEQTDNLIKQLLQTHQYNCH